MPKSLQEVNRDISRIPQEKECVSNIKPIRRRIQVYKIGRYHSKSHGGCEENVEQNESWNSFSSVVDSNGCSRRDYQNYDCQNLEKIKEVL